MSSLIDMVMREIKKTFPSAEASFESGMFNIIIGEEDLKRIFMEYASKRKGSPFIPLFDVRIVNNKIVLSLRVI